MAYDGLTEQQSEFIKKYLVKVRILHRKTDKAFNDDLIAAYKKFQDRVTRLEAAAKSVTSVELSAALLARIQTAESIVGRDSKVADIPGGNAELDIVEEMFAVTKLDALWRERAAKIEPTVKKGIETLVGHKGAIAKAWQESRDAAADGAKRVVAAPLKQALQRLDLIEKTIRDGVAERKLIASVYETPEGSPGATAAVQVTAAKATLGVEAAAFMALADSLATTFNPSLPAELEAITTEINALISGADKSDPAKITAAAAAVKLKVAELKAAAVAPIAARTRWLASEAAVQARFKTLQNHAAKDDPRVQPEVQSVQDVIIVATARAAEHKYVVATEMMDGTLEVCNEVILLADAVREYDAVKADRDARIAKLNGIGATAHPVLTALVTEAKAKIDEANTKKSAADPDFVGAMAALNKIPAMVDKALRLEKLEKKFQTDLAAAKTWYPDLKAWQDGLNPADTPLDPDLPRLLAMTNEMDALIAITNETGDARGTSIEIAVSKLDAFWGLRAAVAKRKDNAKEYYTARTKHGQRLALFEGKPGEEAVREFITRMKADATQAVGAASRKDYHVGTALLDSSKGVHDAMLAQLALGAAFFPKYKGVQAQLQSIEGHVDGSDPGKSVAPDPNAAKAASLVAEVKGLLAEAYSKGVAARDWATATSLVDAAKARAEEALKMLAALKTVDAAKAEAGGDGVAAFAKIRAAAQQYAGGAFADKLAQADAAQKANDAAAAIALCEEVIALAGKKKAYDTERATVKAQHEAKVVPQDIPANNISEKRKEIDDLLKDAEALAKDPGYDFDGASAKLSQALTLVNAIPEMLKARAEQKVRIDKVKASKTKLEGSDYVGGSAGSIARLAKVLSDFEAAENAFDLGKMKTIATQGEALIGPLEAKGEKYKKFKTQDYTGAVEGRWNAVKTLKAGEGSSTLPERERAKTFYDSFKAHVLAENYAAAMNAWPPLAWAADKAKEVARNWTDYKPVKDAARSAIDTRKGAADAADTKTAADLAALEERYKGAVGWETSRADYVKAKALMEQIRKDADAMAQQIIDFAAYKKALEDVDAGLAALNTANASGGATPMLKRLGNKRSNAVALADAGKLKEATALLIEAVGESAKATQDANEIGAFAGSTTKIATDAEAEDADLAALCDAAKAQVSALIGVMDGVALMPRLVDFADQIADAKSGLPVGAGAARVVLKSVTDGLVDLRKDMAHHAQIVRELEAAGALVRPLVVPGYPTVPFAAAEGQTLLDQLTTARHLLRSDGSKADEVANTLETVLRTYRPLQLEVDAHVSYAVLRDRVAPLIEPMEKHPSRYAIQSELVEFREKMAKAEEQALARKHGEAEKLVTEAEALQSMALLKAKMAGDGVPTEDEIKKILDGPDGTANFDKVVKSLDPKAQRTVLRVAFETRFGCSLKMLDSETFNADGSLASETLDPDADASGPKKGPNMKALYDAMSLLPPADTLTNESLLGVTRVKNATRASDHHPGTKVMTMREGETLDSSAYGIGLEHELEGVPTALLPKQGKQTTRFDWNTLHEVGHAVDDKLGFTNRRGKELAGWEYPAKDVGPIAAKVAKHFKYDKQYVERLMLKEADPAIPENEDPSTIPPDEWERRRIEVKAWVPNMFSDREPWQTTSSAQACAIDGTCYHESMPGYWVSYPISERSKGVSGYQFRSPLEWFSELYAAYHLDRLADGHPAREWLDKLKKPEEV